MQDVLQSLAQMSIAANTQNSHSAQHSTNQNLNNVDLSDPIMRDLHTAGIRAAQAMQFQGIITKYAQDLKIYRWIISFDDVRHVRKFLKSSVDEYSDVGFHMFSDGAPAHDTPHLAKNPIVGMLAFGSRSLL